MKKQSKAEEALHKQVREVDGKIADNKLRIRDWQVAVDTLLEIRANLTGEIARLEARHKQSSEIQAAKRQEAGGYIDHMSHAKSDRTCGP